ncbi:MAG: outer membrane protein assembly factor BamD [Betaproteobacteria bacterium]|nr:outer membrane protein assembly factor BamD [Betaproteobacteria bacterium]
MRTSVLALLAAAVLALAGCSGTPEAPDETAGWTVERLYGEARDAMKERDWQKAIKYLEKLEARFPYGRYAQQAQLDVAWAHWKYDERAAAIAAIDRFVKLYPNHEALDYAYYLKGLIYFSENAGLFAILSDPDLAERDPKAGRDAYAAFREVVTRFPDSKYAADAAARMRYLVNSLARHEVHVARYYMKRGAYVAAANRAQAAVSNYPQAPALEEAIFILMRAYEALGLKDLRADAERVMRRNFPDSAYFKGPVKRDVAWWRIWDPDW